MNSNLVSKFFALAGGAPSGTEIQFLKPKYFK